MAYYLVEADYRSEAWAAMVANPQNREEAVREGVEALGGRIYGLWFSLGEYDIVGIFEMPDKIDIAAFMMSAAANPAVRALKTTPLLTMEEGMEAMRKAPQSNYQPPR